MNIKHAITAATLAATLAVGGAAASFASGSGGTSNGRTANSAKVAALCAHQDQIIPTITAHQTALKARITTLTDKHAAAVAADNTKRADTIATRLATVTSRLDRVDNRLAKAPDWIAAHCK